MSSNIHICEKRNDHVARISRISGPVPGGVVHEQSAWGPLIGEIKTVEGNPDRREVKKTTKQKASLWALFILRGSQVRSAHELYSRGQEDSSMSKDQRL